MWLLWSVKWAGQNKRFCGSIGKQTPLQCGLSASSILCQPVVPCVLERGFILCLMIFLILNIWPLEESVLASAENIFNIYSVLILFDVKSAFEDVCMRPGARCSSKKIDKTWSFFGWTLSQPKPRLCCWPEWISTHRRSPGWPPTQRYWLQNTKRLWFVSDHIDESFF